MISEPLTIPYHAAHLSVLQNKKNNMQSGGNRIKFVNPNVDNYERNIKHAAELHKKGMPVIKKDQLLKPSDKEGPSVIVIGSGPTLVNHFDDIREWKNRGAIVFACKKAIKVLHDEGISSEYAVSMDPGAHIACPERIYKAPGVHHIIASSSDPKLFEYLEGEQVSIFHSATGLANEVELYKTLFDNGDVMGGGYNVVNRAVSVAMYMGASRIILVGCDCGWRTSQSFYADGTMNRPGVDMCDGGLVELTDANGNLLSEDHKKIKKMMDERNLLLQQISVIEKKGQPVPAEMTSRIEIIDKELAPYADKFWNTRPDMLASGVALAKLAKKYGEDRFVIIGDTLPAKLRYKSDDFLKQCASFGD